MRFGYEFPRPAVTVDCVLFARVEGRLSVLLIQRAHEPFEGRWAFPGGFVDVEEELDRAAARELEEETGLTGLPLAQLQAFGGPGRDPRGWTITIAYGAWLGDGPSLPTAGSDAAAACWIPVDEARGLAFDHDRILAAALGRMRDAISEALPMT